VTDFFETREAEERSMRRDYERWQRRPSVLDWTLIGMLGGVIGLVALLRWVARHG
jgi:hypothetical protein